MLRLRTHALTSDPAASILAAMNIARLALFAALLAAVAALPLAALPSPVAAGQAGSLEPGFVGWRQARTEHFVFAYEPRDAAAVAQIMGFCEEVYRTVTHFFDSYPKQIWVVVDGRIDEANGDFSPIPPHLTLYLTAPSEPLSGLASGDWLRELFTHELTHYVHIEYARGFFASLAKVFGQGVAGADGAFLPGWMIEGIAVNNETIFTRGGRGRDPFFELQYKGLIYDRRFFSLERAAYDSAFPPQDRIYLGGYLLVRYLLDHYGIEAFTKIHEDFVRFPLLGPWSAIEAVTGKSTAELYRAMVADLAERYREERAIPDGHRVSPDQIGNWYLPVVTARGWYAYRSNLDEPPAIVGIDPATGKERVILQTTLTDHSSLTATRDGSRIVFASLDATVGRSGSLLTSDLFGLDPVTGAVRRITTGEHLWQPVLSPDGGRLLAVQGVEAGSRLVEVDKDSGRVSVLYSVRRGVISTPAISPDGRRVAFELSLGNERVILVLPLPAESEPIAPGAPLRDFNLSAARAIVGPDSIGAFYPQFAGNDRLLFTSRRSRATGLALYEVRLGEGVLPPPRLIASDPVGIWSGLLVDGSVLYGSYRSTGYTLLARRPEPGPELLAKREPMPLVSEISAQPEPPAPSAPYYDLPRFMYWLPIPFYYSTVASQFGTLGAGAVIYGVSNMGRSSYDFALSLRKGSIPGLAASGLPPFASAPLQPAVELGLNGTVGRNLLAYSLSEGYTDANPADIHEQMNQQLSLSYPAIAESLLGLTRTLTLSGGLVDELSVAGPREFGFFDPLSAGQASEGFTWQHDFGLFGSATYQSTPLAAPADLFAPNDLVAGAGITFYPPGLAAIGSGVVASGLFSFSLPSPVRHQTIKLGAKASYWTLPGSFYQIVNPRGDFDPVVQTTPGRLLAALDYQFTLSLLDTPLLLFGLNLQGIGGAIHLEEGADFATSPAAFTVDSSFYAGFELVSLVGDQELFGPIPVGLGLAVKVNRSLAAPFNIATDLRPYLFIGTDSFSGPQARPSGYPGQGRYGRQTSSTGSAGLGGSILDRAP